MGGCATAPAGAPADRYSPAEMKNGPSLYETGHVGVVQPSSGGLRIAEGRDRSAVGATARQGARLGKTQGAGPRAADAVADFVAISGGGRRT